ncbi:MAG: heparan-alpha-glucosaminide N-acetyltransferase domain-containing protein [Leptospiraceae bacterium]|nr:heparan-alpha-glucosaminide N-acetyltransferase domain-containing protein [Leptospiraceae bacterium]
MQRYLPLDALRGLTILLMIVVNNPGSWQAMFPLLRHAEWHGFSGADIVFPLFLFIAGYAAALRSVVFQPYVGLPHCASALTLESKTPPFFLRLLRRSAGLFALGLFLNAWPLGLFSGNWHFGEIRFWGVLQRIALCVFFGGMILRYSRGIIPLVIALILCASSYELLMRVIIVETPFGRFGASFALQDNFARFVDTRLLPETMLYRLHGIAFDPEGLLTTQGALMTFLCGALFFRTPENRRLVNGVIWAVLAVLSSSFEPINKNLWTMSYVALTAAISSFALWSFGFFYRWPKVAVLLRPLARLGQHSLFYYALSIFLAKTMVAIQIAPELNLKTFIFNSLAVVPLPGEWLSLFYSFLFFAVLCVLVALTQKLRSWQGRLNIQKNFFLAQR